MLEKHQKARTEFFVQLAKQLQERDFNEDLFAEINEACGFLKGYYHILFENGPREIASSFEAWQDKQMLATLEQLPRPEKIREQIALALETRIIQVIPKSVALKQSAFFLLPENILDGMEAASRTCDLIWRYAGDKSSDFNYYTKRGLLLPVYLSAKTFYFADNSKDYKKTKEFIASALNNIINIASFKNRITLPELADIPILRLFS